MRKLIGLVCSMACIAVLASGCAKKATVDGTYQAEIDVGSSVTVSEVGMANPDVILPVSLELAGGEYTITLDTDAMARDFENARVDEDHVVAFVEAEDEVVYTGHYTVEDAAINLDDTEQVSLYHAFVKDVLPSLKIAPPVVVMHPPAGGLSAEIIRAVVYKRPQRLIYISDDVATLARDAKMFGRSGYRLAEIQPLDTAPQTYHMTCVALFLPQK